MAAGVKAKRNDRGQPNVSKQTVEIIEPINIAYFDRGYENPPSPSHPQSRLSSHTEKLIFDLLKNDIEALVLPVRLAQQIDLDPLYKRQMNVVLSHRNNTLTGVALVP